MPLKHPFYYVDSKLNAVAHARRNPTTDREMTSPSLQAALDALHRAFSYIDDAQYAWENARRFSGYAKRLQLLVSQLLRSSSPARENLTPPFQTALKGISVEMTRASEAMSVYRSKSKIFVLVKCRELCSSLQERTSAIAAWLALLESALQNDDVSDFHKKISDLSTDMKQALFKVTENEERIRCTLQKEGQGRPSSKAVQSAMVLDLARALGIESNDHSALSDQVKLLRIDVGTSVSISERRILTSLERIIDSWAAQPDILTQRLDFDDDEEGAQITPFKNFLCPLTKEVMKDPVALESGQTYERTAIEYWFERCFDDGREPTCPVSGVVLNCLELKSNIGLAGAIEEWLNRNIEVQIKRSVSCLTGDHDSASMDDVERVLENVYTICEEHPSSRYRVRNAGIVGLVMKLLRDCSNVMGSLLRSKALMVCLCMAKDGESRMMMLEEGIIRLAIRGLIGSSEKEKECAVKILLDFSSDEVLCLQIASAKGALVLLSSMADNLENPSLSNLAEQVLKRLETVENNTEQLAIAGRFEPLLKQLREGSDEVKTEMASIIGRITLTNTSKEHIALHGTKIFVKMLSMEEGMAAGLQVLYSLSCLDDNVSVLIDSDVLPELTDILFESQVASTDQKTLAASIVANIVAHSGQWELASADKAGNLLQSEAIISRFVRLLLHAPPQSQLFALQILYHIASSPHASDSVTSHIRFGDGIRRVITFLENPNEEHRIYAFRLTRVLSEKLSEELAAALRPSNKLLMLKNKILDDQSTDSERSDSACILANFSFCADEAKSIIDPSFIQWTVATLKTRHHRRSNSSMVEGLLGMLLQFVRFTDSQSISVIKEHRLMTFFRDQLVFTSKPRAIQLAALGLKSLSECGMQVLATEDPFPQPPYGTCSFFFMCSRAPPPFPMCPIHAAPCEENSQICLFKSGSIKPLVDALSCKDTSVQVAALRALLTLFLENPSALKDALAELEEIGLVDRVINLFAESRPGELQEKAIEMVDKILKVESFAFKCSLNQPLVRALVDAFKQGTPTTKRHAQDALTNLKQISGVSGQASNHNRGQK